MRSMLTSALLLAYVAIVNGQDAYNVQLLANWKNEALPPSADHENTYNEVWGFARGGREYGVIGSTMGTHIIDVTDPSAIYESAFVPGASQGPSIIHRHFHDYAGYLYGVCDEGAATLQAIDLRFLPDSAPLRYSSNAIFSRAHNIFIDSVSARMYVAGGELQHAVVSLADPLNPTLIKHSLTQIPFWNQIGYVHDNYVRHDTAYLNAAYNGLFVVDFTNINNPVMIGSLTDYPDKGYNHSGWLTDDGHRYILADENFGYRMKMLNVQNLQNIQVMELLGTGVDPLSIVHNPLIKGDRLFVACYNDGLYIWDIAQPNNATIVGWYDTSIRPHIEFSYKGAWGTYPFLPSGKVLVSDMQNGLFVLDVSQAMGITQASAMQGQLRVRYDELGQPQTLFCPDGSVVNRHEIVSISGTLVANGNNENVMCTGLAPGFYTVRAYTRAGLKMAKMVIR